MVNIVLNAASIDVIESALPFFDRFERCIDGVYLLLTYGCGVRGSGVVIWSRCENGDCTKFVYGTGPIVMSGRKLIEWYAANGFNFTTVEQYYAAMEASPDILGEVDDEFRKQQVEGLEPEIDSLSAIDETEFQRAVQLAEAFGTGTSGMLGTDHDFRVIVKIGNRKWSGTTWSGPTDSENVLRAAHELAALGGL